ncbi:MAG: hypothetical protein ACRCV5_10865, partial [Afipia sp.]
KESTTPRMIVFTKQGKDPYEKDGGSEVMMKKEMQSLKDLRLRLIAIRSAIAVANTTIKLKIGEDERSIFDWLTWRREIYPTQIKYFRDLLEQLSRYQKQEHERPTVTNIPGSEKPVLVEYVYSIDRKTLQDHIDAIEEQHGKLDGLLSLKNATTEIEVK